jgi:hypothetical protein
MNSVSDSIAQSIVYMDNALDVWNDLRERFSQADLVRISEIQQEVYALKQDSRSVTEFYSELKLLWEELEIYLPMPLCTFLNVALARLCVLRDRITLCFTSCVF